MAANRRTTKLARQLFRLSLDDGQLAGDRVAGVLAWVEKHRPANASALLRAYKRLVESEIARNRAVIEFAGNVRPEVFQQIAEAMSQKYRRRIAPVPVARPDLIAGVRVRVGCDIYENSLVSQLAGLSTGS